MYQLALFGAGRIGKVHASTVAKHPQCRLSAVVDVNAEAAQALATQYGARVARAEEVFADKTIDGILICSATNTHADLIEAGARAGKVIFCEKPIDLGLERIQTCLNVVAEHKAKLFVGFNRRFDRNFRQLKESLAAGEIGKPELLIITSRDPGPPPISYIQVSGGLYKDMMIHDLDMITWLMDEMPIAISAHGSCMVDPEIGQAGDVDTATVTLEFASGALGIITNSRRTSYGYDQRIEVHGDNGMLQAGNILENTVVKSNPDGVKGAKPVYFFLERYMDSYAKELEAFMSIFDGAEPEVDGSAGERSLRLAEAALESLRTGVKVRL
ncbi:MAG: inositol 2-dehydrogenase [Deinococcales bacterium]